MLSRMLFSTHYDQLRASAVQYRGQLQASALRVLGDSAAAQDAVQDGMVAAVRNLARFRGDSQMSTWLCRIVINQALSRRRVISRRAETSLETFLSEPDTERSFAPPATDASPERLLLRSELRALLRAAVDQLSEDHRTVVILRHYEGISPSEIAQRLDITPNAAKLRLLRAHRALRRLLIERGYQPSNR
jgi:RNA polymerase sigma-70 factor (ECF subfamily)